MIYFSILCQVADRLFSSFGQDILDALYWTATEPKERKRDSIGVIPHFIMAVFYVCILLVQIQRRIVMLIFEVFVIDMTTERNDRRL